MVFARCCKQRTIPFFTLCGWWELKLRYCLVKVGLRYPDDLNLCSVRVTNSLRKGDSLSCSFSRVNCINSQTEFTWSADSLSRTAANVQSVGSFVNIFTTPKLTIWLELMRALLILSTKLAEFLTYDEDLTTRGLMISTRMRLNGWHAEPRLLTNWSQWNTILMFFWKPI